MIYQDIQSIVHPSVPPRTFFSGGCMIVLHIWYHGSQFGPYHTICVHLQHSYDLVIQLYDHAAQLYDCGIM